MSARPTTTMDSIDRTVAHLLTFGSYLGIGLLVVGVLLMAAVGRSPLDPIAHDFDPGALVGDVLAGRPDGPLWLGLVVLLATPSARVAASILGYRRGGDRAMVWVGVAILAVVASGVAVGVLLGGSGG